MAFLLRAFSRVEKQKDKDSSADLVNKTFRAELSNIRSKLAVEDDDIQFLLEMIYDSSFPESQKFLKDPSKDRLFAHKETLSKLLFGLAAKGVPVTQLIVAHMQKYGIDTIPDTLLTLLELIRPLLVSKEIPEFTSDDLLDAIDVQWHSPLRGGSRPQSPFQSPRTSTSASPRFSASSPRFRVSSPRGPFSIYYPGQTRAQDLGSPKGTGPRGSNFTSQSDDSPRPSPNSGWDVSPRSHPNTGLSLPQGQNLQSRASKEKELDKNNLTISQRRQQSETPRIGSSLETVSTEVNQSIEEDGKYLPESKLENSVTRIQTDKSSAQERPEASSKMQHGTQSSQLPHDVHLESMPSLEHLIDNHVVEDAGVSAQAQSGYNQQENGGGKGPDVGDYNGRICDVSSSLPEEGADDTHQEVIPITLLQSEVGQESEAENKPVKEMSDLSKEEEFNTKFGVDGVPTKPSSEIQRDSLDRVSKDIDDSTISEDEIGIYSSLYERFLFVEDKYDGDVSINSPDSLYHINTTRSAQGNQLSIVAAETRRELGDAPIENSDYSNFVCGGSPVEGQIFGNFHAGNKIDRALYSKNLSPNSKDGQGKEVEKDDNVSPRSELYEPGGGEGDSTSFANMLEKNLLSKEMPQEGKYIKINGEQSAADFKLDPKFIGDPSLSRKDNVKEEPPFGITNYEDPSSKFENSQAGRSLLFDQGSEEIEAEKAEGADAQHMVDQYNFRRDHRDVKEHHKCGILEPDVSSKSGMESLPSIGGDEAEVDGGVVHDLKLDDKSLPVPAASITDSSEKEADYVEDGSMKDNKSLRQFSDGADVYPVADTKHGDVASSISSQVCQDTNNGGEAPTTKTVDEAIFLGDHNSNVAGVDVTSFGQTEEAENSVSEKHKAETVQLGEGEDETTQQVEVASITPAVLNIGFGEKDKSKAEPTSGQELAPAQIDDFNTANTIGHHMSHTAENIPSRVDHERNLSEAEAKEFPVLSHESKAGVSDGAGEMDPSEGSSENEEVPRNFDGEIPSNVSAHVVEAEAISGDEKSKLVETREELFCVEKLHDSPGISYLEMSPTNDDGSENSGGEGDNAPVQENDHEDGSFCGNDQLKAGGNKALFLEEAVASEHFGGDMKLTEKEISCVPDEGNEFNIRAISGSGASLHNDESERMLTSDHYSEERLVAEQDESMAGEEATKLMDFHGKEEALTGRSAKEEEINFPKDRQILGAFSTLKPSCSIDDSDKAPHSHYGDQAGVSEKLKEFKLYEGKSSVPAGSEEEDVVVIKHIINGKDRTESGGENLSAGQASQILIAGSDKHDVAITNDFDRHDADSSLSGHIGDEASSADCDMKLVDTGYVGPIQSVADEASEQVEGAAKRQEREDTVALDNDPMASEVEDPNTGDASGDYESNRAEYKDITPSTFEEKEACAPEDTKDTSRRADHIFEPATSENAADSIPAVQHRYFEAEYPFLVSGDPQDEIVESPATSRKESHSSVEVVHKSPAQVEDQSQFVASNHGQDRAEDSSEDSRSNYQGEVVESPDTFRKELDSSMEVVHESPAQAEDQSQYVASNHGQDRAEDNSEDSRSNYQGEVVESPDTFRKELDSSVEVVHESPAQVEDQSQFVASNHGQDRAEDNSEDSRSNYQGEVVESPDTFRKESHSSVDVVHESPAQVEDQSRFVASNHGQDRAEDSSEDSRSNYQGEGVESPDTFREELDSSVEVVQESPVQVEDQSQFVASNHGQERAEDNSEDSRSNYQGEGVESPDASRKESHSSVEVVHESPAQVEDQLQFVASNHGQERAEDNSEDSCSSYQGEVVESPDTFRKESHSSVGVVHEFPVQVEEQSQFVASNHGQERAEDSSEDSRSDYQGEVVESPDASRKESDSSVEVLHEPPAQVEDQPQFVASNHGQERVEDSSEDSRSDYQGEVVESPDASRKESRSSVEVVNESPAQVEDQSQFAASNHGQDRAEDSSEGSRSDYQGEVVESPDTSRKESVSLVEVLHESPAQVEDQSQFVASNHGQDRAEDNSEDSRSNYQGEVVESPDTFRKELDSSVEVGHESPSQVEDLSQFVASNHGQERAEDSSEDSPSNDSPTIAVTAPVEAQTNIEAFHPAVGANAKEESRRNNFGPQIRDFGTEALKKNLSDFRHPNLSKEQSLEKGFNANILQAENSLKPTSEETKLLPRVEQPGNARMSIPEGPLTGILHNKMTTHEDRMFDRASMTRAPLSSTQMSDPILLQPNDQSLDRDDRKHKSHIRQRRLKFSRMCCYCCCRSSPTL